MIRGDPVAVALVPGLAHPGTNITGLSTLAADLEGKRIELLKELLAKLARVAVLSNPTNPFCIVAVESARAAATALHIDLEVVEAARERDLDRAFLDARLVQHVHAWLSDYVRHCPRSSPHPPARPARFEKPYPSPLGRFGIVCPNLQ